ncbi:hypothetical protein HDU97_004184 [Phlyctochytrium planicorne]|nr:hypothetical protein HDU97_004184 [Phlyctochytrium planicorne]
MTNGKLSSTFVSLNSGTKIPQVGLGVWRTTTNDAIPVFVSAIKAGYRHIDTAAVYGNEKEVGEAIRQSGISRTEFFVTTKLWNSDHGYDETLKAFDTSLKKLGLDYIDLYLIHAPVEGKRLDSWRAMEKLYREGKAKAIGVSLHHLKELLANSTVKPAVNQIELHPYLQRKELVNFCKENGIVMEAYCPLTRGEKLNDPKLVEIAKRYNKATAQVLVRWGIEKGYVTLPKSSKEERLISNGDIFDFKISQSDMELLDGFDEGLVIAWDPTSWA